MVKSKMSDSFIKFWGTFGKKLAERNDRIIIDALMDAKPMIVRSIEDRINES